MGIDYGYDRSGRQTLMSATDNTIMGGMATVGNNGAANKLNQVAVVTRRGAMTWSDAGNMKTDGKGTTFSHDGLNRLIKATKGYPNVPTPTMDYAYNTDGMRIEAVKNATGTNGAGMPTGGACARYWLSGTLTPIAMSSADSFQEAVSFAP